MNDFVYFGLKLHLLLKLVVFVVASRAPGGTGLLSITAEVGYREHMSWLALHCGACAGLGTSSSVTDVRNLI